MTMENETNFTGKKLLVLGNSVSSCEIIRIAQKLGAYTIATDYLEDSEFKKIANKSYSISTADIDELEKMAKKENISGVLAGASEFNIDCAIKLSERLGLPFYATQAQWDLLSNKELFKNLCRKYNVPVVEEYDFKNGLNDVDLNNIKYPVIIKPVDSCAGMGISVCKNKEELKKGYVEALNYSKSKRVIVERYMTGKEVVIYYTLQDGYISLSAMCDRYTFKQNGVAPLPTAYIFPSKHLKTYQKYDDENVKNMFKSLGMKNGFLFLQAFVEDGRVRIYEMGYRIAGAQGQNIISAVNGVDALEMLVRFALSGKMSGWDLKTQDNPNFTKWACKLTPILKEGKIKSITGLEEVSKLPGVTKIVPVHEIGDEIDGIGTLKQLLTRIFFVADSLDELKEKINTIQQKIHVYDEDGKEMLIGAFNTDEIEEN